MKNEKTVKKEEKESNSKKALLKVVLLCVIICLLFIIFVLKGCSSSIKTTGTNTVIDKKTKNDVKVKNDKNKAEQIGVETEELKEEEVDSTQSKANSSSNSPSKNNDSQSNNPSNKNINSQNNANTTPKEESKKITQPIVSYSCDSGYDLSETTCIKIETASFNIEYYCDEEGYEYNGNNCEKTVREELYVNKTHCQRNYGTWDSSISACLVYKTYTKDALIRYLCPAGYEANNTSCVKATTVEATPNYTCPNGYTLNENICEK